MPSSALISPDKPAALEDVRVLLAEWRGAGRRQINEADSKHALKTAGLPIPQREPSPLAAVKFCSDAAMHKSEYGLVQLRVEPHDVERATRTVMQKAQAAGFRDGKVLVEEMVTDALLEWFVGCRSDTTFGPIIALGVGGIYADFFGDPVIRLAPLDEADALRAIRSHRAFPIIDGARGKPKADVYAFAEVLVRISRFFCAVHDSVAEIDLNPVLVRPGSSPRSVVIADASLVLAG